MVIRMVTKHRSTKVRQKQIVEAARKVIIKYGSEHVTVKKIAKEVGISETAVYRHFKSKKQILSLLVEHIEDSLVGDVNKETSEEKNPLEILENVLKNHLSAVEQRRGISFQVIAEIISLGDKKLNAKIYNVIDRYQEEIKRLLTEGVRLGKVREDLDLDAAATALFGMVQGLVNIWALNNYGFDPQQKYSTIWGIFREAVIKR
jgi:AcrR family transcriptional regulator